MKRPLFIVAIGLIIGIIGGLYYKIGIVFFLGIIILKILQKFSPYLRVILSSKIIIILIVSSLISGMYVVYLENEYNTKYEDKYEEIQLIGTIISNKIEKQNVCEYTVKIKTFNKNKKYKNTKMILKVKKSQNISLEYGQIVKITGGFEKATTMRNKGGFNYRSYLKTKQIHGIVTANSINIIKQKGLSIVHVCINNMRVKIIENLQKILSKENSGLCIGILIGNSNYISKEIKEEFRDSSLSHMLAVSGAHVSYIIVGITILISKLKINKKMKDSILIVVLIFFIILTGGSPSVQRACISASIMILAGIMNKQSDVINNLSISLIIILLINPYNLLNTGMIMSFAGTIGILYFNNILQNVENIESKKNKTVDKIKKAIIITICANLTILPISLYSYNTLSATFIFSNLIASPLLGIIIILGFFTFFISLISTKLALLPGTILNFFISILINICKFFSQIKLSKIYIKTPSIWIIILYYIATFGIGYIIKLKRKNVLHIWEKKIIKKLSIRKMVVYITVLALIMNYFPSIRNGLEINFIDVGQGDSMLITTEGNKKILVDGGGSKDSNYDVGESTLLPFLLDKGVTKIDFVIISHFDSDHCQGLFTILENLKINRVVISKQEEESENYNRFKEIVKNRKIKVIIVKKGHIIKIDKYTKIRVLWPREEQLQENILNNNSIVAKLEYEKFSLLLTGDIEEIAEDELIQEYNKSTLESTVLKVAHHGSKTSSVQKFLNMVHPKIALIGVGEKNTFGHPNSGVIERLENMRY